MHGHRRHQELLMDHHETPNSGRYRRASPSYSTFLAIPGPHQYTYQHACLISQRRNLLRHSLMSSWGSSTLVISVLRWNVYMRRLVHVEDGRNRVRWWLRHGRSMVLEEQHGQLQDVHRDGTLVMHLVGLSRVTPLIAVCQRFPLGVETFLPSLYWPDYEKYMWNLYIRLLSQQECQFSC